MAQFGIQNNVIPPAPTVNSRDYNTIALVGIAPKGPKQALTLCGGDTDDSQFGKCLTGFNIPRALSTIRSSGAGKVVVVNVFDETAHTTAVTNENATVTGQVTKSAYNPIEKTAVAATSSQSVTTGAGAGDVLPTIKVGTVNLISAPISFAGGSTTATALEIINAINAYTATSGYSAVAGGSAGLFTITGPLAAGANINGVAPVFGSLIGTIVLGSAGTFSGGVNPLMLVKNTVVNAVSAVAAVAAITVTGAPAAGNTLASLKVGLVDLLSGPITFVGTTVTTARQEIVTAINAYTGTSGYSATGGSGGAFTITGPTASGASINGIVTTLGTIVGTLAIATNGPFTGGVTAVTAVPAVTYVQDTDYTIDEYGNIRFIIAIADGIVVRLTYLKLNAAAVTASVIIGAVSGSTRTGCKLVDTCKTVLKLVPKLFIIPGYNALPTVQTEMERIALKYRMLTFYGSTAGMTLAQAIASRGPGGTLATFNIASKKAIAAFPLVYTYDPQTATNTLDDPSAAFAGFLSWNAAINGPHVSPSNQLMPAIGGTEIALMHDWEDPSSAADTNQLRNNGISCVFSDTGWTLWGGRNTSYPTNTAIDSHIQVVYTNHVITDALTAFAVQYVDKNITTGSVNAAVGAMNDYYGTLKTAGWIGDDSKVSFIPERNPSGDLANGKITFTRNTFYFIGMELIVLEENMQVQLPSQAQA